MSLFAEVQLAFLDKARVFSIYIQFVVVEHKMKWYL